METVPRMAPLLPPHGLLARPPRKASRARRRPLAGQAALTVTEFITPALSADALAAGAYQGRMGVMPAGEVVLAVVVTTTTKEKRPVERANPTKPAPIRTSRAPFRTREGRAASGLLSPGRGAARQPSRPSTSSPDGLTAAGAAAVGAAPAAFSLMEIG